MPIGNCDTCEIHSELLKYRREQWHCPKCFPQIKGKPNWYTTGTMNNELRGRFKGNKRGGIIDKILDRGRYKLAKQSK